MANTTTSVPDPDTTSVPDPDTEPTVSVERAAKALGMSRGQGYAGVASGEIPSIRVGRRIVVPTAKLRRLLGLEA